MDARFYQLTVEFADLRQLLEASNETQSQAFDAFSGTLSENLGTFEGAMDDLAVAGLPMPDIGEAVTQLPNVAEVRLKHVDTTYAPDDEQLQLHVTQLPQTDLAVFYAHLSCPKDWLDRVPLGATCSSGPEAVSRTPNAVVRLGWLGPTAFDSSEDARALNETKRSL